MSRFLEPADEALHTRLGVWIDQDLCTGDGLCVDHVPSVFTILEDGIAYCKEEIVFRNAAGAPTGVREKVFNDPGGGAELAIVPVELEAEVIQAASVCPGECIFVEIPNASPQLDESTIEESAA